METVVAILVPTTFVAGLAVERLWPGRPLPRVRRWVAKGIVFFLVAAVLNALLPLAVAPLLQPLALLDLARLGTVGAGLVAFVAGDLAYYAVHRLMHTVPGLWRWTHQLHHSAERVDVAGAAIFHPFDLALQISLATAVALLLGASPASSALGGYLGLLAGVFQHLNLRTPQWLGWIVQRPEGHAVHHARGVHAYNYGNLTIWDIMFGTFRNPASFTEPAGFWDGASVRIVPMLLGRDVATPSTRPHSTLEDKQ